ncbi:type IV conjugative transfer system lipoprotein TraV [Cronobacter malonaticus]|nr:type IV conjugative transfer system lipoprotein TraV [Cronobacter malonaticus]
MNKLILPLLAGAGLLSGCAGMNTEFDCNTVAHDQCMTMEQANQMAAGSTAGTEKAAAPAGKPAADALPRLAPVPVSPSPLTGIQSASRDVGLRAARPAQAGHERSHLLPRRSAAPSASRPVTTPAYTSTAQVYADTGITPPVRVNPTTARLWIAAWTDSDDVYHQPAVVSFVAAPDHWAGS